jgi:hypothetical protein
MQWLAVLIARSKTWRSNKIKNQPNRCKEKMDISTVPIIVTLNDISLEVRKKPASEPVYFTHV